MLCHKLKPYLKPQIAILSSNLLGLKKSNSKKGISSFKSALALATEAL
jgi:hypothetical protein